jgi:ribosomal-protein-serine acetyltransferase
LANFAEEFRQIEINDFDAKRPGSRRGVFVFSDNMNLGDFQQLSDQEICLTPVGSGDAGDLFGLVDHGRDYLREWLPWPDNSRSIQDTLNFIELSQEQFANREALHVSIRFQNKIVGMIGFHDFDWTNRAVAIGYWLAKDFQGKGIMSRSCALLTNYAIDGLGLNRVEIRCAVENRKSRAIPEKLGFCNEGIIRDGEWLHDKFVDLVIYGMLSREWSRKSI